MQEKTNIVNTENLYDFVAKELTGEISKEENQLLLEWVNQSEANRNLYEQCVRSWKIVDSIPPTNTIFNTEEAWKKVKQASIDRTMGETTPLAPYGWVSKVAALFIITLGITWILNQTVFKTNQKVEQFVYATTDNKLTVYLPDSSVVYLNKNSKISYTSAYNTKDRKVEFSGEAFFEVQKNKEKPFEVKALRTTTTVLGTSFSIHSTPTDSVESTKVVTGKVSVKSIHDPIKEVILTPGMMATFNRSDLSSQDIIDPNFLAWKDNRLQFENNTLAEIKTTLENYFDLKINVADPALSTCKFTGRFENPTITEVLQVITISTNTSFDQQGDQFTIFGKGCKN